MAEPKTPTPLSDSQIVTLGTLLRRAITTGQFKVWDNDAADADIVPAASIDIVLEGDPANPHFDPTAQHCVELYLNS